MAESTLQFEHSIRESSAPILALCIDKTSGNFITYDESAVRLWSMKKMIKSTRLEKNPDDAFLDLFCMDRIEKVLVIFTPKRSSESKGGVIRILSPTLTHIQSVNLNYHSIIRFSISPSQSEVVIVDKNRTIFTVHVEFLSQPVADSTVKPKTAADLYHPRKPKATPYFKLHEVQSVDVRKTNIIDVLMVNDNVFAVMGTKTIKLFSRPQLIYVPPSVPITAGAVEAGKPVKKKWMSKKEKAAAATAAAMAAAADEEEKLKTPEASAQSSIATSTPEKKFNEFVLNGRLNLFQDGGMAGRRKTPTILQLLSKDKILVGFDDGSAQIIFSPAFLDPSNTKQQSKSPSKMQISLGNGNGQHGEDESKASSVFPTAAEPAAGTMAAVLCEFQAHFVDMTLLEGEAPRTATPVAVNNNVTLNAVGSIADPADNLSESGLSNTEKPLKLSSLGLRTAVMCPWGNCSGGPGLGYQLELITIGSDRRIAHWGVRFKPDYSDVLLVPHYSSTTRVATAMSAEGHGTNDEEESTVGFQDSVLDESILSNPPLRPSSEIPMETDLLGEYQLPLEPPTSINTGKVTTRFLTAAFELSLVRNPVCKKIICAVGGMLLFFDALQPHRIIVGRKPTELEKTALGVGIGTVTKAVRANKNDVSSIEMKQLIISSAKGPQLSQVLNRYDGGFKDASLSGVEDDTIKPKSTVIILRQDSVELILVQTGQVLQYFSTANLHEAVLAELGNAAFLESGVQSKKGMGKLGHLALSTQLVRNSSINNREVRAAEGKPSCVYWCSITHLILVGYTTGGVGMLAPTGMVHSTFARVPQVVHLQSSSQHGAEITKMITCHHRLNFKSAAPGGPSPPKDVILAIIGDGNGVISVWQIFPGRSGKGLPLLSTMQAHSGKIVYVHSCLIDENSTHRIIVTACSAGLMKAWKLEGSGNLTLTAFFQADLNGAKLTSALAVPSAYYDVVEKEDENISIQSAMSIVSAAPKNLVASLHHEIFCVIGLSNGVIESWILSDNKLRSKGTATARFHDSHSPVRQIIRHPSKLSLPSSLKNHSESVFSLVDSTSPIICLCEDGCCTVVKMNESGIFGRSAYFMLPSPINNAVCMFSPQPLLEKDELGGPPAVLGKLGSVDSTALTSTTQQDLPPEISSRQPSTPSIECAVFSDFKVYHVLPITSLHIPELWHRPFDSSILVSHQIEHGPLGASKYFSQTLALTSPTRRLEVSPTNRYVSSPFDINHQNLPEDSLRSSLLVGNEAHEMNASNLAVSPGANIAALLTSYEQDSVVPPPLGSTYEGVADEVREAIEMQLQAELSNEGNISQLGQQDSISTIHSQSVTDDRQQYVGPMESMQRIVSSELHFAKRDARLLELFQQNEPSANGTVSPAVTVEIVYTWLDTPAIAKENIWELFRLLDIRSTDRLKFVEVAKIAAVVTSAMQRNASDKPNPLTKSYATMKSYTTKVTYNSMGEKSVEKIVLSKGAHEGIFKGMASAIRKIWNRQLPRIVTQAEVSGQAPKANPSILSELPKEFDKLIPGTQKASLLPKQWSSDNIHWFHPLRVIRISRTLLDIRSTKQHEVFFSTDLFKSSSADVTSLPEILVKYFERNYGDAGNLINLSRQKIANFLEACCQYKHHPIVNILQCMLNLSPALASAPALALETATWLCVEARSTLCSRGCVISGELIQPFADDFGACKEGSALQARWMYVPKADALLVTDEMIRERGKFGPAVLEHFGSVIDKIPTIQSFVSADGQIHQTNIAAPMIDLERFLEVLYYEYLHCDRQNRQNEVAVFGEVSMSIAVTAQSRDIIRGKRKLVMDDHISPFGPYHEINLSKIRSWLLEFEPFDPLRTGLVTQDVFVKSCKSRGEMIDFLGAGNTPADIHRFILFCKNRFIMNDPDDRVSYIDMLALLCAWEWQTQGYEAFLLSKLNAALPGIHRTIETSFADNLLKYFTEMSSAPDADPIWTMGLAPEDVRNPYVMKEGGKSSLSLARDGFWNVQSNVPEEAPGSLTVQREPIHSGSQVSVLREQVAVRRERTKLSTDAIPATPQILQTDRVRTTILGETIQPVRPFSAAALTLHALDPSGLRSLDQDVRDREHSLSRASYSRSVENISSLTYQPSLSLAGDISSEVDGIFIHSQSPAELLLAPRPKTPEEIRSTMEGRDIEYEEMASQYMSIDSSLLDNNGLREDSLTASQSISQLDAGSYPTYPGNLLGSFLGGESVDPTLLKKSLAEEEVRRLRREQREREQELEILQRAEKAEMKKRREEKLAMREQIRQEMKRKERAGMAYYRAAIEAKFNHNEKVRQKLSEIAAAEEADKHQKELEILRIQQENKAKSLQKVADMNATAELEAAEKRRKNELKLMRKEDEAMKKISKALERQEKNAREEQNKLAKELAAKEAAELVARFEAGRIEGEDGADVPTTTVDTAERDPDTVDDVDAEEGAEDDDHDHDDDDHDNDGDDHDGEDDEEGGEDDMEDGDDGGDLLVDEEAPPVARDPEPVHELTEEEQEELERLAAEELRKQQSAGQRRMQDFLDRVKESTRRHAKHPRQVPHKFFMPMLFTDDIYFDPFETEASEDVRRDEALLHDGEIPIDDDEPNEAPEPGLPIKVVDPFADVNAKLADFRKEEERKRKLLFATTLQEIPAKDWIRVFRTYTVDWDSFFAQQDAMVELSAAVKESDKEIEEYFHNTDPLKKITDTLSTSQNSPMVSRVGSQMSLTSLGYISGTATPDEDTPPVVTFLPYGKILERQHVRQGEYKYYRLEQFKPTAMLTLEVQCTTGLVDVYLAHQKLPSMMMHDRHVACTKQNKGVVRLAFRPNKTGTFFIDVRSHETDSRFNIWTYSSTGTSDQSPIIARVNTILRKFEILASIDENELQEFYPKYEKAAIDQVQEEEIERMRKEAEARANPPPAEPVPLDDDASINELYDIESVGRFISRVSKYTLTGEEEAELVYGTADLDVGFDDDFQEFGDEVDDLVTPLMSPAASKRDLLNSYPHREREGSGSLPDIQRGFSLPTLHAVRSDITLDSSLEAEDAGSFKLPSIKGAEHSAVDSSFSTKRSIPRSKSSINVAREYAALDLSLAKALRNVPEKKVRVENPYLHQNPKPVKYQLRKDLPV